MSSPLWPSPPLHSLWFSRQCLLTISSIVPFQITSWEPPLSRYNSVPYQSILLNKDHLLCSEIAPLIQVQRPKKNEFGVCFVFTVLHIHRHKAVLYFGLYLVRSRVRIPSNMHPIVHPIGAFVPNADTRDITSPVPVHQEWPARESKPLYSLKLLAITAPRPPDILLLVIVLRSLLAPFFKRASCECCDCSDMPLTTSRFPLENIFQL